jgi:hypothetical protein
MDNLDKKETNLTTNIHDENDIEFASKVSLVDYYGHFISSANKGIDALKKEMEEIGKKMKSIERDAISRQKESQENINKYKEDVEKKIENRQLKTIETLGIFVALFTLVSVEFQIFKIYQSPNTIAGLTLILLGSLLVFVTILDIILSGHFSLHKTKKIPGTLSSASEYIKKLSGYEERVDFNICRPNTWGEGFKLKVILLFIWTLLILIGVLLLIFSPETKDRYVTKEEYKIIAEKCFTIDNNINNLSSSTDELDKKLVMLERNMVTTSSISILNKDLNNNITELRSSISKQQIIIDCFKKTKYWQYSQCFK